MSDVQNTTATTDTALMLKEQFQMPVLAFNKDEMMAKATAIAEQYANIAVTEDTYKAAKADAKKLAGYASDIDKRRKEIKKQVEAPIKQFNEDCQEVMQVLKDAQAKIEAQTAQYDEARLKEQQEKCQKYADEQIQKLGLRPEYASRIVTPAKANNLTSSLKSIKEDYDAQIQALFTEQQDHDTAYAVAESLMDSANQNITQKLSVAKLDFDISQVLAQAAPGDTAGITSAVTALVNTRAQEILAAEEAVRQQAIADERARAEAEKVATPVVEEQPVAAAPEVTAQPVPDFGTANETIPTFGGNVEIPTVPILAPLGTEDEGVDANPMSPEFQQFTNTIPTFGEGGCVVGEVPDLGANPFNPVTPTATKLKGVVEFIGTEAALGPAIQEMIAICQKYGIESKAISCEQV